MIGKRLRYVKRAVYRIFKLVSSCCFGKRKWLGEFQKSELRNTRHRIRRRHWK